jgi:ribonuclease Z
MRPLLHPTLVNGRSGDSALYVETLFEKRAILFDLGDISNLSPRKIQRLEHVFVSHAHIDPRLCASSWLAAAPSL